MGIIYVAPVHTLRVNGIKSAELDSSSIALIPGDTKTKENTIKDLLVQAIDIKGFVRVVLIHLFSTSPPNYVIRVAPEGHKASALWWEWPNIEVPKDV